ncbi:hypothetical protein [Prescottella equi]|uniref:hypothetical protein n=1 Tax=Rhodococcus hoagii TaxID=43767 RepID=UPI0023DA5A8B|nr:hypothetical protein [Prescottella equi]
MSTAEQIIAPHLNFEYDSDTEEFYCLAPNCTATFEDEAGHAAHVVAALTNAGHEIVKLPEADEVVDGRPFWSETDIEVHKSVIMRDQFPVTAERLRIEAGDFLAAARVAEGGERGE